MLLIIYSINTTDYYAVIWQLKIYKHWRFFGYIVVIRREVLLKVKTVARLALPAIFWSDQASFKEDDVDECEMQNS